MKRHLSDTSTAPGSKRSRNDNKLLISMNKIEAVKLFVGSGANPRTISDDGKSCFHKALLEPNTDTLAIFEFLLSHGADPNAVDNNGLSPLHGFVQNSLFYNQEDIPYCQIFLWLYDKNLKGMINLPDTSDFSETYIINLRSRAHLLGIYLLLLNNALQNIIIENIEALDQQYEKAFVAKHIHDLQKIGISFNEALLTHYKDALEKVKREEFLKKHSTFIQALFTRETGRRKTPTPSKPTPGITR